MILRLHNLSARAPAMSDLRAIAELRNICDHDALGNVDALEQELRQYWQTPDFVPGTDAWVLVTKTGQLVGYADVRRTNERVRHELAVYLHVHPDYRERGLATLLIWVVEERARQLMQSLQGDVDVFLSASVNCQNQWARDAYVREGYTLARRFWRLSIALQEIVARSSTEQARHGHLTVDVVLDSDAETDNEQEHPSSALYTARQYEVYTKVLRAASKREVENVLVMHECCSV